MSNLNSSNDNKPQITQIQASTVKKKVVNSIFVVPSSSSNHHITPVITPTVSNTSTNQQQQQKQPQLLTIQKSNSLQYSPNKLSGIIGNKNITAIPINLNNNINLNTAKTTSSSSSSGTSTATTTTAIKVISNPSSTTTTTTTSPLNPLNTNTKKIVISNTGHHITKITSNTTNCDDSNKTITTTTTTNSNNSNNKQVHVVKIINTPSNSNNNNNNSTGSSSSTIKIATVQQQPQSALATLLSNPEGGNNQNQVKLHTYQIQNKAYQPAKLAAAISSNNTLTNSSSSLYIPYTTNNNNNNNNTSQLTTNSTYQQIIHKIQPTTITKTISNSNLNLLNSNNNNFKTQITPTKQQQQNENSIPILNNSRPQITVISTNHISSYQQQPKVIHNTIFNNNNSSHQNNVIAPSTVLNNVNTNKNIKNNNNNNSVNKSQLLNESSCNENDNSSTLDTDAIKLIYDSLQIPPHESPNPKVKNLNDSSNNSNNRKPCNCTKSQCLKLYCDCFAMGSFCHNCNCINCSNTLEHEEERNKAVRLVLERNPAAFQSKIGKFNYTAVSVIKSPKMNEQPENPVDDLQSRHIKGCNCKKSNCLKRYCECYLAKIQCSTLCKCVGCKNCDESTRTLLQLANAADMRKNQQINCTTRLNNKHKLIDDDTNGTGNGGGGGTGTGTSGTGINTYTYGNLPPKSKYFMSKSYAFINNEVAEATSQCLIAQAEECEHQMMNEDDIERLVIEEFGRCLVEIIESAENTAAKMKNSK